MPFDPSNLNTHGARLPAAYQAAKAALDRAVSIDECQHWANKAQALASYARQADDDTLQKQAIRIQSRAIRRCGELLKEFDGRGGDRTKTDGADTSAPTRREAAATAGLSERQQVTAVRVANVPAEQFEQVVESETPPTVTKLADWGRKPQEKPEWVKEIEEEEKPAAFNPGIHVMGAARRLAEQIAKYEPGFIAGGIPDYEQKKVRAYAFQIRRWLKSFQQALREEAGHGL